MHLNKFDLLHFNIELDSERKYEKAADEACSLKRVRLTPWHQHLKNFGQSEGIEPVIPMYITMHLSAICDDYLCLGL